ncbi:hypothetical protein Ahy_A06g028365 [Arachis hypogaea]|uniref:Uncharacterized protein n=1 Tax=Arachis hypogaea TaxID=3818 RepID=A0A445CR19_ARAHY|nr:hypothetical protein Ahy_A06g028365 [Arachis hypogaea]
MRPPKKSIHAVTTWVWRQPPKLKDFLTVISGMVALVFLHFIVHDHDNLFVAAEAVHSLGISVLIYKLMKEKTCADYPFPSSSHNLAERVRRGGLGAAQVKRRSTVRRGGDGSSFQLDDGVTAAHTLPATHLPSRISLPFEKAERVRRGGLGAAQVKRREAVRIELWLRAM